MKGKLTAVALAAMTAAVTTACASAAAGSHSANKSSSSSSSAASGPYGYGGSASASTGSSASTSATAARGATVHVVRTSSGSLLVNSAGFTLYLFTADRRNSDRCVKVSGCLGVWPALTVSGKPTAGKGARSSLLGTIRLPNGHRQVTYAGHPLYRYTGDGAPASTGYLGFSSFGGAWDGVSPSGHAVR
jgi:predicted lipoprotein with Yx(FWY)xxD motif